MNSLKINTKTTCSASACYNWNCKQRKNYLRTHACKFIFRSAWISFRETFMYLRAKTLTSFLLGKIVTAAVASSELMPQLKFSMKINSFPLFSIFINNNMVAYSSYYRCTNLKYKQGKCIIRVLTNMGFTQITGVKATIKIKSNQNQIKSHLNVYVHRSIDMRTYILQEERISCRT